MSGERTIAGSFALLLLASFLSWFDAEGLPSFDGWSVGVAFGRVPLLLGLLMTAHVAAGRSSLRDRLPDLPWPRLQLAAGCIAAALVVVQVVIGHGDGSALVEADVDRGVGLYLAAFAAIGLAVGGVRYERASRPRA